MVMCFKFKRNNGNLEERHIIYLCHVKTSSNPTEKISSPKNMNVYNVIYARTSKTFQDSKISSIIVQLKHGT